MTKETSQPKAINIVRPGSNTMYNSSSHSSSGSTTSNNSQRRNGSLLSATSAHSTRKPRVTATTVVKPSLEKPILNLYHPPVRKSSYDNGIKRPPIELYKPTQQQKMTKSFTAPSLTSSELKQHNVAHYSRPKSPSYIRPQTQTQPYQRSVLGVINTPATHTNNNTPIDNHSKADILSHRLSDDYPVENQQKLHQLIKDQDLGNDILDGIEKESITSNSTYYSESNKEIQEVKDEDADEDEDEDEDENEDKDDDNSDEGDGEEDDDEEEEEPVINEARVNRKIADLELSINSLLTVNAMLEATVRKQASQLSQMKKQQFSGDQAPFDFVIDHQSEDLEAQSDLDNLENTEEDDWENDALFQKLKKITEHMLEQGQKSIDFEYKILGRVLSNYTPMDEVAEEEEEDDDNDSDEEEVTRHSDATPGHEGPTKKLPNESTMNSGTDTITANSGTRKTTADTSKIPTSIPSRNYTRITAHKKTNRNVPA